LTDYEFFSDLVNVVGFLGHGSKFPCDVNRDQSYSRIKSLQAVIDYLKVNKIDDHLFLSVYTSQVLLAQSMGIHSNTIRPAQGTEAELVFWDFVTPVPTVFVDNHAAIVAMSRFKKKLIFPTSVVLDRGWLKTKFIYQEDVTVGNNYIKFLECVNTTLGFSMADINGDCKLKYIFFYWVARAWLKVGWIC